MPNQVMNTEGLMGRRSRAKYQARTNQHRTHEQTKLHVHTQISTLRLVPVSGYDVVQFAHKIP